MNHFKHAIILAALLFLVPGTLKAQGFANIYALPDHLDFILEDMITTTNDEYVSVGYSKTYLAIEDTTIYRSMLIKTDDNGNVILTKVFNEDIPSLKKVMETSIGYVIIAERVPSLVHSTTTEVLIMVDFDANVIWSHEYNLAMPCEYPDGAPATSPQLEDFCLTPEGNIVLAGGRLSMLEVDLYSGLVVNYKSHYLVMSDLHYVQDIHYKDGYFYVLNDNHFASNPTEKGYSVTKLNSNLDVVVSKRFRNSVSQRALEATSIDFDSNNTLNVVSYFKRPDRIEPFKIVSETAVMNLDPTTLNVNWVNSYELIGVRYLKSNQITHDNWRIQIGGYSSEISGENNESRERFFTFVLDPAGYPLTGSVYPPYMVKLAEDGFISVLNTGNLAFAGNIEKDYSGDYRRLLLMQTDEFGRNCISDEKEVNVYPLNIVELINSHVGVNCSLQEREHFIYTHDVLWEYEQLCGRAPLSLSTTENQSNQFKIYPNPSNGTVFIELPNESTQVRVLDITGRLVSYETKQYGNLLTLSHLTAGTYLVELKSGENSFVQKLIIQ